MLSQASHVSMLHLNSNNNDTLQNINMVRIQNYCRANNLLEVNQYNIRSPECGLQSFVAHDSSSFNDMKFFS